MLGMVAIVEAALLFWAVMFATGVTILIAVGSWKSGLRSVLKRSLSAVFVFVLMGAGLYHWRFIDARSGITDADCDKEAAPNRQYVAQVCYAGKANVLRLWSADGTTLLAERTFERSGDPVPLWWKSDRLEFDSHDQDEIGTIKLPPTLKDRLLARLP